MYTVKITKRAAVNEQSGVQFIVKQDGKKVGEGHVVNGLGWYTHGDMIGWEIRSEHTDVAILDVLTSDQGGLYLVE